MAFNMGDRIHGFIVKRVKDLDEYKSSGIWLDHEKSGAQVYHVQTDDPENFFSFGFKTLLRIPPEFLISSNIRSSQVRATTP